MKILHLSDTHGKHRELPPLAAADVVVHSGDFTFGGSEQETLDFFDWFCDLPHPHKVVVAGNHDLCMFDADGIEGLPDNVHYLRNSGVVVSGVGFYGIPMFMEDCMAGRFPKLYRQIPDNTDVVITHQPPFGFCDMGDYGQGMSHRGDAQLAQRIMEVAPRLHLFGHEHDARAVEQHGTTLFSNAAVLDRQYRLVGSPVLFTLPDV